MNSLSTVYHLIEALESKLPPGARVSFSLHKETRLMVVRVEWLLPADREPLLRYQTTIPASWFDRANYDEDYFLNHLVGDAMGAYNKKTFELKRKARQ